MTNPLLQKLKKKSFIENCDILNESEIFNNRNECSTPIPALNIAYSGKYDGGISSGLTIFAGKSRHFKSMFALVTAASYLQKYPDAICVFYDVEFGSPPEYFESVGIDSTRVLHKPFKTVEELTTDISNLLNEITKEDKVFIIIDSIGNAASSKEVKDSIDGSDKADMTRAKMGKRLWRIVTPHLKIKDIPLIAIAHTYESMCLDENTIIKTEHGGKPIKDIVVGEKVYSKTGLNIVTHTFDHETLNPHDKKYLELEFDDGSTIKCTSDHKFLMADGVWIEAGDMNINSIFY